MGGSSGSSPAGSTQVIQTQNADPWKGIQPYLVGGSAGGTYTPTAPQIPRQVNDRQYIANTGGNFTTPPTFGNPGSFGGSPIANQIDDYYQTTPWGTSNVSQGLPPITKDNYVSPPGSTGGTPGILPEAAALYKQGPLDFYRGQMVANFSPDTQAALSALATPGDYNLIDNASGQLLNLDTTNPANQQVQSLMNQAGVNPAAAGMQALATQAGANPYSQPILDTASGGNLGFGQNAPGLTNQVANQAFTGAALNQDISPADDYYRSVMGGDYLGGNQFMDLYGQDIQDQINQQFAGRSGSAYHGRALGDALGRAAGRLYTGERQLQQQAAGALNQTDAANRNRALQAAGSLSNIYGRGLDRNLTAGLAERGFQEQAGRDLMSDFRTGIGQQAGLQRDLMGDFRTGIGQQAGLASELGSNYQTAIDQQLAGLAMAPGMQETMSGLRNQDTNRLMQAGLMRDERAQRLLDLDRQRFEYEQAAPWENLNRYASIVNQVMHGTPPAQTSTTQQPYFQQSRLGNALGGALGGGALFGPWGALGGGVLGLLS
jgi:hypothetical protein